GLEGVVEGADAVGGDHEHLWRLGHLGACGDVQLADLAGDDVVPAGQVRSLDQGSGGGAHAVSSVPAAASAARRAISVRWWLPARPIRSVAERARVRASARSVPRATTDRTRPPALTSMPSAFSAVPAWMTCAPSASASSIPVIGSPEREVAG